jgi:hypothetical protein
MKTLILKIIPLLFILILPGIGFAQTITTTAGTVTYCPGVVVVPVNVTNCNGVGAISLALNYNNTVLTYTGYQNVHAALSGGMLIVNSTGSKVIMSWASTTPANVGNNVLIEFTFTGIPGASSMTWDTQTQGNCEFSDSNGNILPASFVNGTATVRQQPLINTDPVDKVVLVGQNTSFSVSAIATGITYQWQLSTDGGTIYNNLSNNSTYSGVTTASLGITSVQLSMNGYKYRCVVSGTCPPPVTSNPGTLTVVNPITTTLPTTSICPGNIVVPVTVTNFTAVAAFSLAFSYNASVLTYTGYQALNGALSGGSFIASAVDGKVYMSWSSSTGVTFGNGTIVEVLFANATGTSPLTWDTQTTGNCEYSYENGSPITSVFVNGSITTYGVPAIVTHPTNKTIAKGQNTSFSITASGSGLSYLWQLSTNGGSSYSDLANGGVYSGVTTATLNITGAPLSMNGYLFRCRVSGTCTPQAFSNPGLLTVLPNIITTCQSASICPGQLVIPVNVTDFISVGAFSMVLQFNSSVLTYTGYQNLNTILNGGSFAANAVAGYVYISWSRTTAATLSNGAVLIELKFNGVTGSGNLTWDTQTPGSCEYSDVTGVIYYSTWINGSVTVYQPPQVTSNPTDKTIYSGGSTNFSITATGTGLGYQWQESTNGGLNWNNLSNSTPYSGVYTATLSINPASQTMNGYRYRCYVTGTCTPYVYSESALLTVTLPAITTTAQSVSNSCSGTLEIPVNVTNCNNVGAISLVLDYDSAKLDFDGYDGIHPELSAGMLIINDNGSQILLSWASTDPAVIGSGMLIRYHFQAEAGISTTLSWNTQSEGNCEYSDISGTVITSFYVNGTISVAANALIADAGNDVTINPGGSTQLNGTVTGGTGPYDFLWTPSTGLSDPEIPNPLCQPASTTTYTLAVTDFNNCTSTDQVTVTISAPVVTLNLKIMLEGPFVTSQMNTLLNSNGIIPLEQPYGISPWFYTGAEAVPGIPDPDITDWILVELRQTSGGPETATSGTRIARKAGFLLNDGHVVDLDGASNLQMNANITQNLYVVVWHRNHLGIMSANPVTQAGGVYTYDFTNSSAKAYGGTLAQKQLATGVWGMISGDGNGDGMVDTSDKAALWGSQVGKAGYLSGDFNMNAQVNNQDKNDKWLMNTGFNSQVPD